MASNTRGLIFDLGGVLLDWDLHRVPGLSSGQFLTTMNTTTWHDLDRGVLSLKEACREFGELLGVDPATIESSLEQAQLSLTVNCSLVQTIHDLEQSNLGLKFYVMSNISREHFQIVKSLEIPWSIFNMVFTSGAEGMRKPDLCFFQHVIKQTGLHPDELLMVDDSADNICAARSLGMHGMLVDNKLARSGGVLRNLFQDPMSRAERYMSINSRKHHCTIEGHEDLVLKDNFSQLLIWELTGNADIVYLEYPSGKVHNSPVDTTSTPNRKAPDRPNATDGLWNYFYGKPILTTSEFPPDADTTSIAYLSLPEEYLNKLTDIKLVLETMAENIDAQGIMQLYFSKERPRINPEAGCNILRAFYHFGYGYDPRIRKTKDWVVKCLENRACLDGNRYYSTPEGFLYYVARLYVDGPEDLKQELVGIHEELEQRINVPTNPLALALRISACQLVGVSAHRYNRDFKLFMSLQQEDGGWPAGHFCCMGRIGARIGNRGLTTALALQIIKAQQSTPISSTGFQFELASRCRAIEGLP
ncbi:HAD-like protein [Xylaria telfairii]|nr:HAD-like protein [Xylaria telfairii]